MFVVLPMQADEKSLSKRRVFLTVQRQNRRLNGAMKKILKMRFYLEMREKGKK